MNKFKVNDRVRLLDFSHEGPGATDNYYFWVSGIMDKMVGETYTISNVADEFSCNLDCGNSYYYMNHWLELEEVVLEIPDELFEI